MSLSESSSSSCWKMYIEDIQLMFHKECISRVRSMSEKPRLTSEIHSIFNVKIIEFSVYYIFVCLSNLRHCMRFITCRHNSLLFFNFVKHNNLLFLLTQQKNLKTKKIILFSLAGMLLILITSKFQCFKCW